LILFNASPKSDIDFFSCMLFYTFFFATTAGGDA